MPTRTKDGLITLTSDEVLRFAEETLLQHVSLSINGKKCTLQTVFEWRLEAKLNEVLVANLTRKMLRVRCDLAIDLVLVPYHGQPDKDEDEVRRSQAREGTTHFHCYATAYMVYKDQRITLALTFVRRHDTMPDILRRLFKRLNGLQLNVKKLYLDKGFYSIAVIRLSKARGQPFIIPAITRRKGGVSKLFIGRASYSTSYTMRNQKLGTETVDLALTRKYSKGRYRRRRFGIESSYRQMNRVRARTSSTNPALRLLYVGVAFLLIKRPKVFLF
jgi:hypothetical protein